MDKEKVIKGLEWVYHCISPVSNTCGDCPYQDNHVECKRRVLSDALTMLKEQEAVKRTYRTGINGFSIIWTCGACGSDLYPNNAKAKYCSNCGQAVKWE